MAEKVNGSAWTAFYIDDVISFSVVNVTLT